MIEYTIVDLKRLVVTWIICPIVPSIFTTSIKSVLTVVVTIFSFSHLAYCGFLNSQHLHIYPQKLKKKGYDYDKDQIIQA
jgi:hypothetical protein